MKHETILALHGNIGSPADWAELDLAPVRSMDLWEHTSLSFFEMAHELATSISQGMDRPVLAGYSLGGRLALHAMAIHPQRWRGAIIASAHPGLDNAEDRSTRRLSDGNWAEKARTMPWDAFLEKWNEQGVLSSSKASPRQLALEKRRAEIAMAFETWSLGRQENLRKPLRGFSAPVLWIVGEDDEKFRALGEEMMGIFADFTLAVIPNCGHRVLGDASAAIIRSWMEKL